MQSGSAAVNRPRTGRHSIHTLLLRQRQCRYCMRKPLLYCKVAADW